jgi:hypothetical protein
MPLETQTATTTTSSGSAVVVTASPPAAAPPAASVPPAAAAPAAAPPAAPERAAWSAPTEEKKVESAVAVTKEGEKKAEEAKEIKYEFKAPDGQVVDQALAEKVKSFSKELGLSPEQAQKVYDRDVSLHAGLETSALQTMKEQNAKWFQELKADKEFGNDKFGENSEAVKRAFEYGDSDGSVRKGLTEAMHENWPPLVRMMRKFGKLMADDKLHSGSTAQVAAGKDTRSTAEKMKAALEGPLRAKEYRK